MLILVLLYPGPVPLPIFLRILYCIRFQGGYHGTGAGLYFFFVFYIVFFISYFLTDLYTTVFICFVSFTVYTYG